MCVIYCLTHWIERSVATHRNELSIQNKKIENSEVEHWHENPVSCLGYTGVTKSIIYITMHK